VSNDKAMSADPIWSLVEAAEHTGVSRATVQRLAASGKITGAYKDLTGWKVPMSGLIAAGLTVSATPVSSKTDKDIEAARELFRARGEAERWRMRAEGLERELARADQHLSDMRRTIAIFELERAAPQASPVVAEEPQARQVVVQLKEPTFGEPQRRSFLMSFKRRSRARS